jgi:hypothetical protein
MYGNRNAGKPIHLLSLTLSDAGSFVTAAGKYWTAAHNLQQSGFIDFTTSEVADGPRHDETWTFTVIRKFLVLQGHSLS